MEEIQNLTALKNGCLVSSVSEIVSSTGIWDIEYLYHKKKSNLQPQIKIYKNIIIIINIDRYDWVAHGDANCYGSCILSIFTDSRPIFFSLHSLVTWLVPLSKKYVTVTVTALNPTIKF